MIEWVKERFIPLLAMGFAIITFGYYLYSIRAILPEILPEIWDSIVAGLVIGIVHIGMAVWVYQDAKKRGHEKPAELAMLPVIPIVGLFGLLLYFSTRDSREMESWLSLLALVIGLVAILAAVISHPVFPRNWLLMGVVFFLAYLEIPFAVWVFRDAENRGVDDPIRFAAVVLVPLLGLLVFISYLSYRHRFAE